MSKNKCLSGCKGCAGPNTKRPMGSVFVCYDCAVQWEKNQAEKARRDAKARGEAK